MVQSSRNFMPLIICILITSVYSLKRGSTLKNVHTLHYPIKINVNIFNHLCVLVEKSSGNVIV